MKRSSLVVWQQFGWRLFHLVQYVKLVKEPVPKLTPDVDEGFVAAALSKCAGRPFLEGPYLSRLLVKTLKSSGRREIL